MVSSEKEQKIYCVSLIKKKFEYVYMDLGRKQYCTIRLDHQKEKQILEKNARVKRLNSKPSLSSLQPVDVKIRPSSTRNMAKLDFTRQRKQLTSRDSFTSGKVYRSPMS